MTTATAKKTRIVREPIQVNQLKIGMNILHRPNQTKPERIQTLNWCNPKFPHMGIHANNNCFNYLGAFVTLVKEVPIEEN